VVDPGRPLIFERRGGIMKLVATREQLHEMIDDLPEADVDPVAEILASRVEHPVLQVVEDTPVDDEQPSAEEEAAKAASPARRKAIEHLLRIASGEDDGYDFSVSEQLHAAR
jgi:hypothetical protein